MTQEAVCHTEGSCNGSMRTAALNPRCIQWINGKCYNAGVVLSTVPDAYQL